MKVVLNVESLVPPLTGIGYYTQQLVRGLHNHAECDLSCFAVSKIVDSDELLSEQLVVELPARKFTTLRRMVRGVPGAYKLRSALRNQLFVRATKKLSNTIYHEPNYILKPFDGVSITTIHDLSYIHYPQYHPRERVRYMERELPITLERADRIITDSEYVKEELISMLGVAAERITAIPLGVGAQYHPRSALEVQGVLHKHQLGYGRYLLAVATIEPRKNLTGLINAYMRLPLQERRRFPLVLVGGRGWQCHELEERIARLVSAGELCHLGYVAAADLPAIYAGAAAFAFPSHYEGFGLPPLEAMSSGVPVLTSANSAMAEVVGDAGFLVDAADDDTIYAGLERLLLDDLLRQRAIEDGLQRVAHFTWERCVDQTLDIYRKTKG